MKARGNHPVQVLLLAVLLESGTVLFMNLKQKDGSTSKCNPKWIRAHWLARKPQRRWLEVDSFHLQYPNWFFRMLSFASPGNLGDKLMMKERKWIVLYSG